MTVERKCHEVPELLLEHERLRQYLQSVRETLQACHSSAAVVRDLMDDLADNIQAHFDHEEKGGYFAEVIEIAPRLATRVEALLQQHPNLSTQLDQLKTLALQNQSSGDWWQKLAADYDNFLACFQHHETAENQLLQEAYHDDVGAED